MKQMKPTISNHVLGIKPVEQDNPLPSQAATSRRDLGSTNGTWVLGKGRVSPQDVDGEARGDFSAGAETRMG